jgi:DNA-binding Lrp family transcriptional regulator
MRSEVVGIPRIAQPGRPPIAAGQRGRPRPRRRHAGAAGRRPRPEDHRGTPGERPRVVPADRLERRRLRGDGAGLGFDQALVGIKTSGPPSDVADEIARWPEADYVVVTAGQFDLVVEVVASDRHEMLDLTNRMRGLPGVASTETFFYLEMWKQLYDWGTRV